MKILNKKKLFFFSGSPSDLYPIQGLLSKLSKNKNLILHIVFHSCYFLNENKIPLKELIDYFDGLKIFKIRTFTKRLENKNIESSILTKKIDKFLRLNLTTKDFLVLLGDRLESLVVAQCAYLKSIKILHFSGGQISNGSHDNVYRYNISNFSEFHFVTSQKAKSRLRKIPIIKEKNIYMIGSCSIDDLKYFLKMKNHEKLIKNINNKIPYVFLSLHPEIEEKDEFFINFEKIINQIIEKKINIIASYPNNDNGSKKILELYKKFIKTDYFNLINSSNKNIYLSILKNSLFLIGNSSSFIIEAPYLKKIIFLYGHRQNGREIDKSIFKINYNINLFKTLFEKLLKNKLNLKKNNKIFGTGNSIDLCLSYINKITDE